MGFRSFQDADNREDEKEIWLIQIKILVILAIGSVHVKTEAEEWLVQVIRGGNEDGIIDS